jgi:hypothetical protein
MKREVISGSIFEIPLEGNIGYAYCQVHLFKEIVITLFDFFNEDSIKGTSDLSNIINAPFLTEPKILMRLPSTRGKFKWTYLGNEKPILKNPIDFRMGGAKGKVVTVVQNGDLSQRKPRYSYDDVKHLPIWTHMDFNLVRSILTCVYCKRKGISEESYRSNIETNNHNIFILVDNLSNVILEEEYWEGVGANSSSLNLKAKGDPIG